MIYHLSLILIILFLCVIFSVIKCNNYKNLFLKCSFLVLFLFLALRSENVGTDLVNYKLFFNYCNNSSLSFLMKIIEPGYAIYSYYIYKIFNGNFQIFLAITAFFSLVGPYYFIKNNSEDYFLSVLVFICLSFYLFCFSGLRQSIALSIILFSIKYIKDRKFIKYLTLSILAFLFHKSSIIFLPAYFLFNIKINKKHIPLMIFIPFIVFIFRFRIMEILTSVMYSTYSSFESANGGYNLLMCYLILFVFISLFKSNILSNNKDNNLFYNMFYVGIIFQILATVEGNGYRAAMYYVLPLVTIIPSLSLCFNKNSRNFVKYLVIILLVGYYLYGINNSSLVSNYSFFWN